MLLQISINYGQIVTFSVFWTACCTVIYYIDRIRSRDKESRDIWPIIRRKYLILIIWLIPFGILVIYSEFIILIPFNPFTIVVLLQLIIIVEDIIRHYQVISKDSIKKL